MARERRPGEPLKGMRERFCQAYANDPKRNATKAAKAAGYAAGSAYSEAHRLLKCVDVRKRIVEFEDGLVAESVERGDITPESILAQLEAIASGSGSDGARVRALELLGKHYGLWVEADDDKRPAVYKLTGEELDQAFLDHIEKHRRLFGLIEARFNLVPRLAVVGGTAR
jgi:hypothetical protein